MDNCTLKGLLIFVCVIVTLVGLYLSVAREKRNIANGTPDIQDGGANLKDGSLSFKFAIGLAMIVIGLCGAIYSSKTLPGCDELKKDDVPSVKDTVKPIPIDTPSTKENEVKKQKEKKPLIISEEDAEQLVQQKNFTTSPLYISTSDNKAINIVGLKKEGQNVLKLKGFYRFHTDVQVYPTNVTLSFYSDDNFIKSIEIDVDTERDLKLDQTIFVTNAQKNTTKLHLKLEGLGLFNGESDYLEFKNGITITFN